jgi:hypothetical protein
VIRPPSVAWAALFEGVLFHSAAFMAAAGMAWVPVALGVLAGVAALPRLTTGKVPVEVRRAGSGREGCGACGAAAGGGDGACGDEDGWVILGAGISAVRLTGKAEVSSRSV